MHHESFGMSPLLPLLVLRVVLQALDDGLPLSHRFGLGSRVGLPPLIRGLGLELLVALEALQAEGACRAPKRPGRLRDRPRSGTLQRVRSCVVTRPGRSDGSPNCSQLLRPLFAPTPSFQVHPTPGVRVMPRGLALRCVARCPPCPSTARRTASRTPRTTNLDAVTFLKRPPTRNSELIVTQSLPPQGLHRRGGERAHRHHGGRDGGDRAPPRSGGERRQTASDPGRSLGIRGSGLRKPRSRGLRAAPSRGGRGRGNGSRAWSERRSWPEAFVFPREASIMDCWTSRRPWTVDGSSSAGGEGNRGWINGTRSPTASRVVSP